MNSQELRALQEAYTQVYQELEEGMTMDDFKRQRSRQKEESPVRKRGGVSAPEEQRSIGGEANRKNKDYWASVEGKNRDRGAGNKAKRRAAELNKEEVETDLFDHILEHLVAEGYADTNEAAIAIMANMSEEWKQSICEEENETPIEKKSKYGRKAPAGYMQTRKPTLQQMYSREKEAWRNRAIGA